MMFHASFPKRFWVDAFGTVVWLINRLPTQIFDMKGPYEELFG